MDFRHTRPPPPQPPPPSDPHQPLPQHQVPPPPGPWYSGQFPYHSPSPPPPQWATPPPPPPHSEHHLHPPPPPYAAAAPPPPMPYSSNHYSLPPRPHMPPPPHPHYPPVNQEWSNSSWGHHYSAQNKNEDDWAARARAWAASKAVTDDQHHNSQVASTNRPEETNYQDQYQQNLDPNYQEFQQHSVPQSNYHQYPSSFEPPPRPPANHLQESGHFSHTVRDGSLSVHQQEVPSSYSSVAEEPRDINGTFYQQSHMPFASAPHHQVQSGISPNNRPVSVEQSHYSFNNLSAESATDLSNQPLDFGPRYGHDHGPFGQSAPPGMPYSSMTPIHPNGPQVDPSMGIPSPVSMHSGPLFGRVTGSSFQPTMQSANTVFPVSNVFPGDAYGNPGFPERPKKASVPNWLREEIIKKKTVIGNSALELSRHDTESNEDEFDRPLGRVDQVDGKGTESSRSTEEEDDDEDYVDAAKTAAINQEIKSILTEVLLKVTDELFDEIATKVLEEDEVEHKAEMTSAAVITPKSSAKILIPPKTKVTDLDDANGKPNSSSPGDVLGLGSYASDDDEEEEEEEKKKEVQNSVIPSSNHSPPPVHLAENGCSGSQVDHSHEASPIGDTGNHNDSTPEEVKVKVEVKPDSSDISKSMPSEIESVKTENLLPDDQKHSKVDENSRAHDDRYVKRAKKEDQNGSKKNIKDRDSEKKVNKGEIKDDKKERDRDRDRKSNDKEESRKREKEKEKDDKNERSKYKPVNDSGRHMRHHSPSPGGRGRSIKDSSSDDSRRRLHSKRRDLSPSPVRSRRQVSPCKRSHHRHSNYSSLETTRERRRSRSRSRSRRG